MKLIIAIQLRWRLWCVCRKLGIKPYKFQRQFALTGKCKWPSGRCNGKTMAVMLYGLIRDLDAEQDLHVLSQFDPDVIGYPARRRNVFVREYYGLLRKVKEDKS